MLTAAFHASGRGLVAGALGLVAGSALQLQQPALWALDRYVLLALAGLLVAALGHWGSTRRRGFVALAAIAMGIAALAFGATGLRATDRLADGLPAELEGRDIEATGVIASLPQRGIDGWRFRFEVESARLDDAAIALPARLALGWYAARGGGASALPELRAGQRWRITVRLKRPHGAQNPHGHDLELQLFEQGVRASGYVRAGSHRLLDEHAGHPLARARQAVREAIGRRLGASDAAGLLAALVVGDQGAIDREDWALYRATGVAHLMSISGLHVTMFAWLAGLATAWLWRRSSRAMLWCPAPRAARWGGLAAALAYAAFAGWGVPAQRTVLMLAVVTALASFGLRWPALAVWLAAMAAVTLADPWALLQPGFWLSFVAVGLLMISSAPAPRRVEGAWPRLRAAMQGGLRTQVVATLGLAPLTLLFFQQLSLVGFVANLAAIPLVTLAITPLAMLGVLLPPLWLAAAALADVLHALLQALAAPGWALWSVPAAAAWAAPAAVLAAALLIAPLPWRLKLLALPLGLPLFAPTPERPAPGAFDVIAVDVGQGTAVLVRTAGHALLYDAGPQYSRESDAGERVLVPLLRALGHARLDALLLSHRDTDHVGGAPALLKGVGIGRLSSSLAADHPLLAEAARRGIAAAPCVAGQRWRWDGVDFELLHPEAERLERAEAGRVKPNTLSCVLKVSRAASGDAGVSRAASVDAGVRRAAAVAGPRSLLLTGDLEREQELALVARDAAALRAELMLVPHHGSKTSSSPALLDAVGPRVAIVQAGYRNRFGHPAAEVAERYAERGIELVASPRCGAWTADARGTRCRRAEAPRYWQHPDFLAHHNGVEVAISAEAEPGGEQAAEE
ncbi:MAG TPA: DNA internalization-related competence protein ComEC/Rec2 [Methylibium sp.]|uniref:DNA internalization-related competence protein ComEC/Rec2 n=1 Tax=Methylibium sp. TaxID=2067992 RepID=UPI002DBDD3AD|nr:DNA internalization-related competence protein ComEC/Rec2 [Methylibium sp.]HEU4459411.1 DNA internalization-related competence protein ComEC/Rec2 [Methylibium sp.]